jgi:hypothetical protein
MRTLTALTLAAVIGLGASLYTPAAKAGGVYVGVGLPAPVVAGCVAPGYYGPTVCAAPFLGYAGWGGWGGYGYGHFWGRGPGFYGHGPAVYGGGHWGHGFGGGGRGFSGGGHGAGGRR